MYQYDTNQQPNKQTYTYNYYPKRYPFINETWWPNLFAFFQLVGVFFLNRHKLHDMIIYLVTEALFYTSYISDKTDDVDMDYFLKFV